MFSMKIGLQMVVFRTEMGSTGNCWQTVWSVWWHCERPFPMCPMNESMALVRCSCGKKLWSLRANLLCR